MLDSFRLKACLFTKKRLLHRCFPISFAKKKKKLRTTFGQDISERLHFNLSQPSVLKYLFTTLQSNKAFKSDFICCLMSNFRGVIRTLSNIQDLVFIIVMRNGKATFLWLCFYLLTIAQNDSSIRQYVC